MKAKVSFLLVILISIGIQTVMGQVKTTPGGGSNAGPGGPSEEGGGSPSTTWHVNANGLHVNGYSNIGIGTNLPTRKLDIYGAANTLLRVTSNGSAAGTHVSGIEFKRIAGQSTSNWDIVNQNAFRIRKEGIPVLSLDTSNAFFGSIDDKMSLNLWGKEITKTNGLPATGSIVIKNNISGHNQTLRMDASQLETDGDFYINYFSDKNVDMVQGGGKVRINTLDTGAQLNLSSTAEMQLKLINPGSQGGAWNIGVANGDWLAGAGKLVFSKTPSSSDAAMVITPAGNVGIGLTNPSRPLQVNGITSTKILEITGGADFAENFDVVESDMLLPGTIVSISTDNSGQLRISDKAYDKTVAGIISGAGGIKPGMLMGQEGTIANGKHPVALTGRVYCLADASHGEINPGDLLTTSPTLGHAMKVTDHEAARGAIIGKAMTSIKNGKGLVLVLVSLQ
ncbi:MAG TPA: hypothetical protein VFZ52_20330 [Chryseolinea sp.]